MPRFGERDVSQEMHAVLTEIAANSPDRIVTLGEAVQAIREKYWDFDDNDAQTAFANLLLSGLIAYGEHTSTFKVAKEGEVFEVPSDWA